MTKWDLNINKYLLAYEIRQLCEQIRLPEEVIQQVLRHIDDGDFSSADPHFASLFIPEKAKKASEAIDSLCLGEDGKSTGDGFKLMAVFLAAALHTREIYEEMGIGENIFIESMGFFRHTMTENLAIKGYYFFDRAWWWWHQISLRIFRLGTLEFEMSVLDDASHIGFPGEKEVPVLSVHIPSDAVLTRNELDNSYSMARIFFKKHFPDFKYKCMYVDTWLLSPALKELLPPDSNILEFQKDFVITRINENDTSFFYWLYMTDEKPNEYRDIDRLPENTSLRRSVKKRLLEGGKIGAAAGVVFTR